MLEVINNSIDVRFRPKDKAVGIPQTVLLSLEKYADSLNNSYELRYVGKGWFNIGTYNTSFDPAFIHELRKKVEEICAPIELEIEESVSPADAKECCGGSVLTQGSCGCSILTQEELNKIIYDVVNKGKGV